MKLGRIVLYYVKFVLVPKKVSYPSYFDDVSSFLKEIF